MYCETFPLLMSLFPPSYSNESHPNRVLKLPQIVHKYCQNLYVDESGSFYTFDIDNLAHLVSSVTDKLLVE